MTGLKKSLKASVEERRSWIEPHPWPSKKRQCELLELPRSTAYYRPKGETEWNLALMRRLDELYTQWPFYGSRRMTAQLIREKQEVNRKRVSRLMRLMGIEAIYCKPRTTKAHPEHRKYPYLLREPNHGNFWITA